MKHQHQHQDLLGEMHYKTLAIAIPRFTPEYWKDAKSLLANNLNQQNTHR